MLSARRGIWIGLVVLSQLPVFRAAGQTPKLVPGVAAGMPIDLRGKSLDVDVKQGSATLSGEVVLRRQALELRCDRLEAKLGRSQSLVWAKASGHVQVRLREFTAQALSVEADLVENRLVLLGGVRVSRGRDWMKAERAEVDLRTERVSMSGVEGSVSLPAASQ